MKVVCINDNWKNGYGYTGRAVVFPVLGEVYTAFNTITCPCGCKTQGYELEEMDKDTAWLTTHFEPYEPIKLEEICNEISLQEA